MEKLKKLDVNKLSYVIKKIAKSDDSWHLWFGYAMGGVAGSILGIKLSLFIHGH